jgi:hypothetical protein
MPTQREYQKLYDQIAALRELMIEQAPDYARDPAFADALTRHLDNMIASVVDADLKTVQAADAGFAQLVGIGSDAATRLGETHIPQRVEEYDETIASERIRAVSDLYYIYQHEKIGVFRVVRKLKQLFEAGTLRLSSGEGAFGLYRFDKREVLRYTRRDRLAAYRRVFGYGSATLPSAGGANSDFHNLFTQFIIEVTQFWRDKRISDVIRERADDPSFGSIASVRRAGLDLRNNLKWASYGHVNVMRVEVMQLLDEAFRILNTDDVKSQFGSENAWDVIEEVLTRYFGEHLMTSPRQRMAVTGRDILRWLGDRFILESGRPQFESKLFDIADDAEEWITSAETLGLARRPAARRSALRLEPQPQAVNGGHRPEREFELEGEL